MRNLKFQVIYKYLRPYKKEFLYGAFALLIVNVLSVVIPLEVKNIIDQLQNLKKIHFVVGRLYFLLLGVLRRSKYLQTIELKHQIKILFCMVLGI